MSVTEIGGPSTRGENLATVILSEASFILSEAKDLRPWSTAILAVPLL